MSQNIKIDCSYNELIKIDDLKPHPKNPNAHSQTQIDRLAKIIKRQGIRAPTVVSKDSGYVICGHGRIEALRALKVDLIPVNFQSFKNEAEEYAHMVADNAIANWSELDLTDIRENWSQFDEDVDLLGLENFELEIEDLPEGQNANESFEQSYSIVVECVSEKEQEKLYNKLTKDGYKVKPLNY